MAESAALLADDVFPDVPLRQWVISFPFPLRYLFAAHPQAMGKVLTLKTPYRDGTTQVAFEPVDFIARLTALVPKPRVNLTRYHGVLAPNHRWRAQVTPARRGKGPKPIDNTEVRSPAERHAQMTWAQRLKRVFNIDIETCGHCGGNVRVIACIEDLEAIDQILDHMRRKEGGIPAQPLLVPPTRAPPGTLPLLAGKGAR